MIRGWRTSEGQMTGFLLLVGTVLEASLLFLQELVQLRPELGWVPVALAGVGALLQVAVGLGYVRSRTALKGAQCALVLVIGWAIGAPPIANAEGFEIQVGPTVALSLYRPGSQQIEVLPGAGLQVSLSHTVFDRDLNGARWKLFSLELMGFGSLISRPGGEAFGALSVAVGACTLSSLICLVGGRTVLPTESSAAADSPAAGFIGVSLGTNLPWPRPPASASIGRPPPPAANTIHVGL